MRVAAVFYSSKNQPIAFEFIENLSVDSFYMANIMQIINIKKVEMSGLVITELLDCVIVGY